MHKDLDGSKAHSGPMPEREKKLMKEKSWLWRLVFLIAAFYLLRHFTKAVLTDGPRGDLDIVMNAARRWISGEAVYRLTDDSEHTKPPLLMALSVPLLSLPRIWLRVLWDLLNLALPFLILRELTREKGGFRSHWREVSGTVVLLAPLWYIEAVYGQYNLLILWMTLVAARWAIQGGRLLECASGFWFAITLIIKPTQLFLAPWLVVRVLSARDQSFWPILRAIVGGVLAIFALGAIYVAMSSWEALVADHRQWLAFIPQSAAKHVLRDDNFGIPTLLVRLGLGWIQSSPLFVVLGLGLTSALAWRLRRTSLLALSGSLVLMLAFSPMCWRANFGILIPLVFLLFSQVRSGGRLAGAHLAWIGVLSIFALSRVSPYWLGDSGMTAMGRVALPLWLAFAALVSAVACGRGERA